MTQEKSPARITPSGDETEKGYLSALDIIRQAHEEGRPIVPFLGAGISAGSGYPLIDQLRSYLLKVKFFIKCGVYRTLLGQAEPRSTFVDDPENHLSVYIEKFGWPDLNQLNSDLYQYQGPVGRSNDESPEPAGIADATEWINRIVYKAFEGRIPADKEKREEVWNQYREAKERKSKGLPEPRWGRRRWRLQTTTQHVVLEDLRLHDEGLANIIQDKVWAMDLHPRVDWSRLLMELTEGKLGFIDALFARLSLRYSPGASHVLLAHLVARLGIKLLLTTNFDPFVEQALLNEGAQPRLFEIGRDAPPPDPSVVQQTLSVVKLHGGNSGLRIGERLDYALDEITQRSVEAYVPGNALLLVVGFSGYERRMMQLIEHLVLRSPDVGSSKGASRKKVVWMHYEPMDNLPATLIEFERKLNQVAKQHFFCKARLSDAAAFLLELYQNVTIALPKSRTSYPALQKRIIRLPERKPERKKDDDLQKDYDSFLYDLPFHLFSRDSLDAKAPGGPIFREALHSAPSVEMSMFVHQRGAYHLIWIDLEDHHTVAGVVAEIIDKMRIVDSDLPPLVFPLDHAPDETSKAQGKMENRFEKAASFIHRALRRGRYILAFDSLEGFGRAQTSHHGLPGATPQKDYLLQRMSDLLKFLRVLLAIDDKDPDNRKLVENLDWYCCIACDEPASRHLEKLEIPNSVREEVRDKIRNFVRHPRWKDFPTDFKVFQGKKKALQVGAANDLSSFRKHRVSKDIAPRPPPGDGRTKHNDLRTLDLLEFDSVFPAKSGPHSWKEFHERLARPWQKLQGRVNETIRNALKEFHDRFKVAAADIPDDPPAWLHNCALPFLMLCVFRRPRSYVAIYTLWNQYLPGDWIVPLEKKRNWIKTTLDGLSEHYLLNRMPGGYYWVARHVHEWMYKALSEPARLRDLKEMPQESIAALGRPEDELSASARVMRLAFLTMIHSRIARFYFLHVFQRVQDVNALFEYVYHRVSAIRYALTLQVYFKLACHLKMDKECRDSVVVLLASESIEGEQGSPTAPLGVEAGDEASMLTQIESLRIKFLQSFLNVLRRERETMLTAASTDTWLAWITQLTSELGDMVVLPVRDALGKANEIQSKEVRDAWPADVALERADVALERLGRLGRELKWYLDNLRGQLLREKRAWLECIQHRVGALIALLQRVVEVGCQQPPDEDSKRAEIKTCAKWIMENLWNEKQANESQPITKVVSDQIQGELQNLFAITVSPEKSLRAVCLKEFQDDREGANHLATAIESLLDIAACCRHLYPKAAEGASTEGRAPAGPAQWYHAIADRLLIIFARKPKQTSQTLDAAQANVSGMQGARLLGLHHDLEFDRIRFEVESINPWWHRHIDCFGQQSISNGEAASAFPTLKWVQDQSQKIDALRQKTHGNEFNDADELAVRMCQFRTQVALCLMWLEHCDDALRTLDEAMNGLREDQAKHRFLLAIVQCLRAETLMLSANQDVRRRPFIGENQFGELSDPLDRANEAPVGYDSARTNLAQSGAALQEAERLLRNGRRNIGQWRRLYLGKVQLEIESLLLLLTALEWDQDAWPGPLGFVAKVHGHLTTGLEAIRGGWDCSLSPSQARERSEESKADRQPWLGRWLLLMMAGFLALKRYDLKSNADSSAGSSTQPASVGLTSMQTKVENRDALDRNREEMATVDSFVRRWHALNESAGLNRFVRKKVELIWKKVLEDLEKHADKHGEKLKTKPERIAKAWSREIVLALADETFGKNAKPTLSAGGAGKGILQSLLEELEGL